MTEVRIDFEEDSLSLDVHGLAELEGSKISISEFGIEYLELAAAFSEHHIGGLSIAGYARRFWENEIIRSIHAGAKAIVWRAQPTLSVQKSVCLITDKTRTVCRTYGRYHFLDYIPGTLRK